MEYTTTQIEKAKLAFNKMMIMRTVASYDPQYIGWAAAEQRCAYQNKIVSEILAGNKELEKKWKLFFLSEVIKSEKKAEAAKLRKASANVFNPHDVIAPIRAAKKVGEFGKWLNTRGNQYRNEYFTKSYSQESVNAFLSL